MRVLQSDSRDATDDNAVMAQVSAGELSKLAVLFERHHRSLVPLLCFTESGSGTFRGSGARCFLSILRYRASYDPGKAVHGMDVSDRTAGESGPGARAAGEMVGIEDFTGRALEPVSEAPGPEERAVKGQDLGLLQRALNLLPQDKREILTLSRFQEMKYEDIAAVLGLRGGRGEGARVPRDARSGTDLFRIGERKGVMTCEELKPLLAESWAGTLGTGMLNPEQEAAVEEHLGSCQMCRDESARLSELWQGLALLPADEPGTGLRGRFYGSLSAYRDGVSYQETTEEQRRCNIAANTVANRRRSRTGYWRGRDWIWLAMNQASSREIAQLQRRSGICGNWSRCL